MNSQRKFLPLFDQLKEDFNNEQININKQQLEKALYLSQLFLKLAAHKENGSEHNNTAKETTTFINQHHDIDHLKGDTFWQHLRLYLASAMRITSEFVEHVAIIDIPRLSNPKQESPIFCFLHNELHFKDTNPFYNIFRYLECASKLEDSEKKYNRKVQTFNDLIAIFNSDDSTWMENCEKLITNYQTNTLLFNRKGKFIDLLNVIKNETQDLEKTEIDFNDFFEHIKYQNGVLTLVDKLTNLIHPSEQNHSLS